VPRLFEPWALLLLDECSTASSVNWKPVSSLMGCTAREAKEQEAKALENYHGPDCMSTVSGRCRGKRSSS
jgi:hypothetical protein